MCCKGIKKSFKSAKKIATGYAYLAAGINQPLSEERMKVCRNCVQLSAGVCKVCGCAVDAKTRLPEEACPLKKWMPKEP